MASFIYKNRSRLLKFTSKLKDDSPKRDSGLGIIKKELLNRIPELQSHQKMAGLPKLHSLLDLDPLVKFSIKKRVEKKAQPKLNLKYFE